jgi:hypothetical protein
MSRFAELLAMANYQQEAVKLLLLFAKASVENQGEQVTKGSLEPVMCVDKLPAELGSFSQLCQEADAINQDWDFVFITSISADVDESLIDRSMKSIVSDIQTGQNTSMYIVLDRQDNLVEMVGS